MVSDGALFFIYFVGAKVGNESLEGRINFFWGLCSVCGCSGRLFAALLQLGMVNSFSPLPPFGPALPA